MNSRHIAQIEHLMQRNRWTIDRTAAELNTDTPTLRWFLNEWPAESVRQQMRLNAIVSALDAREDFDPARPVFMRRTPSNAARGASDSCKRGHLYMKGSYYISADGRRLCYECQHDRRDGRRTNLLAARDAISTLNGRGLRDVEIASITYISNATISEIRRGGTGISAERTQALQQLVAVTNDLTGAERPRTRQYAPHPMIEEIRARYESVSEKVAA